MASGTLQTLTRTLSPPARLGRLPDRRKISTMLGHFRRDFPGNLSAGPPEPLLPGGVTDPSGPRTASGLRVVISTLPDMSALTNAVDRH